MSVAHEITAMGSEKIDVMHVTRKILASEPEFAGDVEAQIKWCKAWGGGLSQKTTKDVCAYIKRCEGDIYHVSSTHFEECAKVKVKPTRIPGKFVAAMVKCIATRSKNGTALISAKKIKSVIETNDDVHVANDFMIKAEALCATTDGDTEMLRGDIECDLVEHVFETREDIKDTPMQSIVERFVRKLNGLPQKEDEAEGAANAADDECKGSLFDATDDNAVFEMLKRTGVKLGALLIPKTAGKPLELDTQFVVSHINGDGSVGVRRVNVQGGLDEAVTVIKLASIPDYTVAKKESRIKPSDLTMLGKDVIRADMCHMVAEIALRKLYAKHCAGSKHVITLSAPKQRLLSGETVAVGDLVLVPYASHIDPKPLSDDNNDVPVVIEVMVNPSVKFKVSAPSSKKLFVPFWKMSDEKKDNKLANMKLDITSEQVNWPVDIGAGKHVEVKVPVAVNDKSIQKHTEIRLLKITGGTKRKATLSVCVGDI